MIFRHKYGIIREVILKMELMLMMVLVFVLQKFLNGKMDHYRELMLEMLKSL